MLLENGTGPNGTGRRRGLLRGRTALVYGAGGPSAVLLPGPSRRKAPTFSSPAAPNHACRK